jgi:hypothetical protein
MNTKLSATFAAVACLTAASQAKATVNQSGDLLWTSDLPGVATGASVTPVVITTMIDSNIGFSFTNSGATFSGPASGPPYGYSAVWTGPIAYPIVPGSGLAATTNYIATAGGPPATMTPPKPEGYLGFLASYSWNQWQPFNVTLYSGNAALGEITAAQLESAAYWQNGPNSYAWININVADGGTYTSAVFSSSADENSVVFDISYGSTSEAAPLPALAGTIPGFAAAVLGMLGLRRRSRSRRA